MNDQQFQDDTELEKVIEGSFAVELEEGAEFPRQEREMPLSYYKGIILARRLYERGKQTASDWFWKAAAAAMLYSSIRVGPGARW